MPELGATRWTIPEGHIPSPSNGPEPQMTSHETACILNAGDRDAVVEITCYFSGQAPVAPYHVQVPARRTAHVRFNDLDDRTPRVLDACDRSGTRR